MNTKILHQKLNYYIKALQHYTDRFWYPYFIGLLAALDNLVIFIPNDGILISSSMLTPRRWFLLALIVTIGSTCGAILLAILIKTYGSNILLYFYPELYQTKTWLISLKLFDKYGLLLVFLVALSPIAQQPAVVLTSLSNISLLNLALVIFSGRFIKYLVMAYVGSHTPRLLKKMWGVKDELKELEIKYD